MNSITTYKAYFQGLAADNDLSFEYGGVDRILERQSSSLVYPLLWLEVPDIALRANGGTKMQFQGAFLLLQHVEPDNYAAQDEASQAMLAKGLAMLSSMELAGDRGEFEFMRDGVNIQPKQRWSADDDFGWRFEFTITGAIIC